MHYHFIGIKGSGMASLAEIVADRGDEVSGSDIEKYILRKSRWRNAGSPSIPSAQTTFMKATRSSSASPSMRATRRYTRPCTRRA